MNPSEVVSLGEELEALVLTKEDKASGPVQAGPVRAGLGHDRGHQGARGRGAGPGHRGVKGGLIIDIGQNGFLPASLVATGRPAALRRRGKIIELDKNRNNVVLSRRAFLILPHNLKPGETRRGVVSSVCNFGAFVDLGGMDG